MTDTKQPVAFWDIDKLKPYAKNAKKHSDEQIARLSRSIAKLGVTPLQVEPDGTIIAGHGRRLALLQLGRAKVPVIVRDDLTKDQCDALRIADNAAVSNDTDIGLLQEETIRLSDAGFELDAIGLTEAELTTLLQSEIAIDDSAFTDDISLAVEMQKAENLKSEAAVDAKESPIGAALGFKKVTTEQSRLIRGFMAKIEAKSGLKGADAFVAHINTSQD
jgi:hypothetical protein